MSKKHGYFKEPWYNSYRCMMHRCYNPNAGNFCTYGGRGIGVCEEWHDIHKFKAWVDISGYEIGLTLDRINANGNYCPENCRWATKKQQSNNRRNNIYYEFLGKRRTLAEWSRITGINRDTLWSRVVELNWSTSKALTTIPINTRAKESEVSE